MEAEYSTTENQERNIPEQEEEIGRDNEALRVFNEELQQGEITVNHARLIFMGKNDVGKTCLVNSLLGKPFNEEKQSNNGKEVLTTAFGFSEWKEETENIDDSERTKQMLEAVEKATSNTEHDVVSSPGGSKLKRGKKRKKDGSNSSQTRPRKTLKRIGDTMEGETSQAIDIDDITFMWDFSGQQLNYITQRIFLASEAVYLILFNLAESMHDKGKCRISKMAKYEMAHYMTNIQIIKYWMRLIFTYAIPVKAKQQLTVKKPQIVVVGTHSDCLEGTDEDKKKKITEQFKIIFQEIRGTPYEPHVMNKMYAVSNKFASECEMLKTLKQDVGGFLKAMPKTVPLKWLKFQQILQEYGKTALRMTYDEVCNVAGKCGISVENVIHTLNYLHDLGIILYFENNKLLKHTVITNPRKLICIFKKIITVVEPDDFQKLPVMNTLWNKLDDEGILEEKLVRYLWKDEISKDETCFKDFLELMKQFGLLCKRIMNQESTNCSFFVPCRLKRSTENMAIKQDSKQMVSIYMASEDFIPDSIFHPLVVSLIEMVQEKGYAAELQLFKNYANIHLGRDHALSLGPVVIKNKPSIKLEILRMPVTQEDGTERSTGEPSPGVCMQVLDFLKEQMKKLTCGMKHTGYKFRVMCWTRLKKKKEMHFHDLEECLKNDCIPCRKELITTSKLQRMFKNKQDEILCYLEDKHLLSIASGMGQEGKLLGVRLGLSWNRVKEIWSDKRQLPENIMEMLTEWRKQQNYETNQAEVMCRALKEEGLTEVAKNVFGSVLMTVDDDEISESQFNIFKTIVSKWYDENECLTMLKVLFRDMDNVNLAEITDTIDLLNKLVVQGKMSEKDPSLLYDTIRITGHMGLKTKIKEKLPSFPDVEEGTFSTHFTDHRQKLMKFGNKLTPADVKLIDGLCNTTLKRYRDSWSMITDLEDKLVISEGNMDEFIESLKILELPLAVKALTGDIQ